MRRFVAADIENGEFSHEIGARESFAEAQTWRRYARVVGDSLLELRTHRERALGGWWGNSKVRFPVVRPRAFGENRGVSATEATAEIFVTAFEGFEAKGTGGRLLYKSSSRTQNWRMTLQILSRSKRGEISRVRLARGAQGSADSRVSWRVKLGRDAKNELARISRRRAKRVARVLLSLETDPFPPGCKKPKIRDGWRVRVGDYRILYFADKAAREVLVGVIAHRREVYRR